MNWGGIVDIGEGPETGVRGWGGPPVSRKWGSGSCEGEVMLGDESA